MVRDVARQDVVGGAIEPVTMRTGLTGWFCVTGALRIITAAIAVLAIVSQFMRASPCNRTDRHMSRQALSNDKKINPRRIPPRRARASEARVEHVRSANNRPYAGGS
jgi:hypothetical protein